MFKKQQANIEHEYINYNSDDLLGEKSSVPKSSLLSTIIRLLTIAILFGILTIGSILGYRFLQNDTIPKEIEAKPESVATLAPSVLKVTKEEKMYTQDEMQAIMQMMMQEMQKKEKITTTKVASPTKNMQAEASLITSLESIEVDHMEEISREDELNNTQNTQEVIVSNNETSVDNYNKVLVTQTTTNYDNNVDALSLKIGELVKEMEQTKPTSNSTYTQEITKEVHTRENAMRIIIVRAGDTLSKIASRAYGSAKAYNKIYEANPDLIKNPNHIYIGQRLRVPLN